MKSKYLFGHIFLNDAFLISAMKNPDFFVKNIITYEAGRITASIKTYKSNVKNIRRDFHIPVDMTFATDAVQKQIADGGDKLVELVNDQVGFYKKYWFFYLMITGSTKHLYVPCSLRISE
jgi:hypothetical protein